MALLTRANLDDLKLQTKVVLVPEWGGDVCIRELTGTERDSYEASIFTPGGVASVNAKQKTQRIDLSNARARLVALCLIDDNGQRLYKDNEIYALGKLNARGLDRVYDECRKLSGITDDDQAEIEAALKNSESAANGDFGSV